jgi:hypothetical protein
VKSSKSKGKNNARHKKFKDQQPAAGPGLAGALVPLLEGGERTRAGHRRVRRDARRHEIQGGLKKKCGEVKGRLRRVGPCRGLHCGDWSERGDVM